MKMLKTKHLRRLAVFLAMIAPAVYLFGVSFSALTGAHGTQVFADSGTNSETIEYSFSRDFGIWLDSGGVVTSYPTCFTTSYVYPYPTDSSCEVVVSLESFQGLQLNVTFYHESQYHSKLARVDNVGFISFSLPSGADSFRVSVFSDRGTVINSTNYNVFPLRISSVSSSPSDYYSAVGYSRYWFNRFFPKDNFLVQWGENAISENPRGFAPFGAFWRYLDINVLHLSNDQVGLMGYGYIYYACHVLLFDIGFILVTFFLDFIQKIADKFTGGE